MDALSATHYYLVCVDKKSDNFGKVENKTTPDGWIVAIAEHNSALACLEKEVTCLQSALCELWERVRTLEKSKNGMQAIL